MQSLQPIADKLGSMGKRTPLSDDEREGIVLAVNSAFRKLKNLYAKIEPIFDDYGFKPPSAGGHRSGSVRED